MLAVLIPILHFFLVPALLIAGPALAYYAYYQERRLAGGEAICPDCSATLKIEKGSAKWPCDEMCTSCRTMLKIDLP